MANPDIETLLEDFRLAALGAESYKVVETEVLAKKTRRRLIKAFCKVAAERDALRAQLDGMTTEWGVGLGDMFMNLYETRENAEFVVDCRGDMDFRLMSRHVSEWVEVTD